MNDFSQLIIDSTKVGWHKERVEAWDRGERIAPITMDIALTRRCNAACLAPNSRVMMADGSVKRIADIKAGDWLASSDENGAIRNSVVMWSAETSPRKRLLALCVDNDILRCTSDHPILTRHGWVEAGSLKEGDYVATANRKGEDRQREGTHPYACEQSHEATGRSEAHGTNEEGTARSPHGCAYKGTPRERDIPTRTYDYGTTSTPVGAHVRQQPDEDCVRGGASDCHQQGERQPQIRLGTHEADMGRGEDYVRSPEDGRWPQNDQQKRVQTACDSRPIGAEVHGRLLVLADGHEEREEPQPGFCVGDGPRADRIASPWGLLASSEARGYTVRDGRLFSEGLEGIHPVDGGQDSEAAYTGYLNGGLGVVIWRQIESISDAGYSPVFDLECLPYHNFIAEWVVVHNCGFCAAKTQASASASLDIPKEIAFQFFADAAEIGVKGISLISDGESTLVDYYAEAIEEMDRLGLKVGLGTNGIAFDREILERILPHVTYLRVNFSAGERQRYAEIMGVKPAIYDKVMGNIRDAVEIRRKNNLTCNLNMNLVCDPKDADQLLPFARIAKELGVDYAVIKHCYVDNEGVLDVSQDYSGLAPLMKECEALSGPGFRVIAKWDRLGGAERKYNRCYGPMFIMQMSGNGLVAPCGPLFNEKNKAFHIGSIMESRFKDIFYSDRYKEVMDYLASEHFDPSQRCPKNCLQHHANDWLFRFKNGKVNFPITPVPQHPEFI